MKKMMNWMKAAILICGTSVFMACSLDDDPTPVPQPDLNLPENIIGKWMVEELDGQACPTNLKAVITFLSSTKAYGSLSDFYSDSWNDHAEADVVINRNDVTLTAFENEHTKHVTVATVSSITDKEMILKSDWKVFVDDKMVIHEEYDKERYIRITSDYRDAILGTWEGHSTGAEGSEFDDGENHRWEYLADGTFHYYHKVDGQWQLSNDVLHDYFVDGILLCTRWKNAGEGQEENREWWEIESIQNGVMKWTALRMREDGSTYTATFEMTKVQDTWDAETGTLIVNTNPGKSAYEGRTDIVSVVFNNGVTSIGDRAFYNCPISVVDIPASVVSIGSEAFAGKDSDLDKVTIYATDCTFGEHPFLQSILTNVYVPAESLDAYKASYPGYKSQIYAIPEVELDGNEIIWSEDLCEYILVKIPYYHKDRIVAAHNTQGGITVTFTGTSEDSGFDIGCISLVKGEKLTFTSTVGNISHITIQAASYDDEDDEEDATPIADGWTWDAAQRTFTWQGTPATAVEMLAVEDVNLDSVQIQFTIE